jgi:hypothetical protein
MEEIEEEEVGFLVSLATQTTIRWGLSVHSEVLASIY